MIRWMTVAALAPATTIAAMTIADSPVSARIGSIMLDRQPKAGEMADFTLVLVDGTKVTARDLRGQVVILNYWATWCVPCRTELPLLDRYYALRKANGLRVFAATTEDSVPLYRLKPLFAAMQIPAAKRMTGRYANVSAVPTNYIIDRSGRIRYAKAAALSLDDLNREITPLLNEPAPPPDGTN